MESREHSDQGCFMKQLKKSVKLTYSMRYKREVLRTEELEPVPLWVLPKMTVQPGLSRRKTHGEKLTRCWRGKPGPSHADAETTA